MVLPLVPALALLVWVGTLVSPANDRFQFWYAGHLVATGHSPYDQSAWASAGPLYGDAAALVARNCPDPHALACLWAYPPWTAWLFVPFGILPPYLGMPLLASFLLLSAAIAIVVLTRAVAASPASAMVTSLATVVAAPFVWDSLLGHFEPLELIGAVLLAKGLRDSQARGTVSGALLLALKPHLFLALAPLVLGYLVATRAWRVLWITSMSLAALAALGLWREPAALAMIAAGAAKSGLTLPTTWSFAERVAGPMSPLVAFALLAASVACAWIAYRAAPRQRRHLVMVAGACGLSLAVAPYLHLYDHVLLALPIGTAIGLADTAAPRERRLWWLVLSLGFMTVTWLAFLAGPHGDEPSWVALIPLLALAGLAAASMRARRVLATAPEVGDQAGEPARPSKGISEALDLPRSA